MDGSNLGFDLSWSSEVKSNFPPHLELILKVCTNYVRTFMLFSESAQFCSLEVVAKAIRKGIVITANFD